MTKLEYVEEIRRWRGEKYNKLTRLYNAVCDVLTLNTSGSKGEGLTCILENDMDFLFVVNGILCVEDGINWQTIPDDIDLFRMDTRVYPGHCRLLQERHSHNCLTLVHSALGDNGNGDILLSSFLVLDELSAYISSKSDTSIERHERAGPSSPETAGGVYHIDKVVGLRCHCPSILLRWAARPRHWPPPVIVRKVVSLGAYVTPVGFKGSEYSHMEWGICFNTDEAELVNNLNDTQVKVYAMLKMIFKKIFKPNNKEITSYVLKNIILWQAENNPQTKFHARSLFHWLPDGLRELRNVIEKKPIRYYMISERNLIAGCGLEDALQSKWIADITDMIEACPRVLLRLEKIRKAIVGSPEPSLCFSKKRMELEILCLELFNRRLQCDNENRAKDTDFIVKAITKRGEDILREVRQRMLLEGSSSVKNLMVRIME